MLTRTTSVVVIGRLPFAAELATALQSDAAIRVLAQAADEREGLEAVRRLRPDLAVLELTSWLPECYQFVERLVTQTATRVLAVTPIKDPETIAEALAAGALDVVAWPSSPGLPGYESQRLALVAKVKLLAHVRPGVVQRANPGPPPTPRPSLPVQKTSTPNRRVPPAGAEIRLVAIVSSTGGPAALERVLKALPHQFPAAIVVVQHIAHGFVEGLVEWYSRACPLPVEVARDGEAVGSGRVWLAADGHHLLVADKGFLRLTQGPPVMSLRPCGDLLLESVAQVYGPQAVGVVLTGMGSDGARGLKALHEAGGRTIAQDQASSAIFGMPRAAIETGAADEVLHIDAIGERLVSLVCKKS